MKLLHIDSSITGDSSATRQITARIVESFGRTTPSLDIVRRDLAAEPLAHLDGAQLASLAQDPVLDEFLGADTIVIGAPMYNFAIPSQLKAWIDRILVAGKTFRYTEKGAEGLARGKTVIVASSRGGFYASDAAQAAMDFQENYLRAVFRFIGIEDFRIVRAEGIAIGPQQRQAAMSAALEAAAAVPVPAAKAA